MGDEQKPPYRDRRRDADLTTNEWRLYELEQRADRTDRTMQRFTEQQNEIGSKLAVVQEKAETMESNMEKLTDKLDALPRWIVGTGLTVAMLVVGVIEIVQKVQHP